MKVRLVIVPPGGGEADYSIDIEMPAIPSAGDYITVKNPEKTGTTSLIVKRRWWDLQNVETRTYVTAGDERYGSTEMIAIECYPAEGMGFDTKEHKGSLEMYEARGKGRLKFDNSMY